MIMKKISLRVISLILFVTIITGQAQFAYASHNLATWLATDQDPMRNTREDIARKLEPGAIGNGQALIDLIWGNKLPRKTELDPASERSITEHLSKAIKIAITLHMRNQNYFPEEHRERAEQTLANLIECRSKLSQRVYLFNADIKGPENYLLGFNGLDTMGVIGLETELIERLWSVSAERLAQYVYHECVPEHTQIDRETQKIDREDHRRIYEELQTVVFGKKEVSALKTDMRGFISEKLRKGTEKTVEQIVMQATPEEIMEAVIKPVSGVLPEEVKVSFGRNTQGVPVLTIEHMTEHKDRQISFSYKIEVRGNRFLQEDLPVLSKTNILVVPEGEWTEITVEKARNAWRRMIVADPVLHPRFRQETFKLEEYQEDAVEAILEDLDKNGNALAVMATATGKTVVAFEALKRYMDKVKQNTEPGNDPGAVLFIVNSKEILREAEEKLHLFYKNLYATSHIYEGKENYSGDIIFATPSSLASQKGRIEKLLKKRRISMVIFDEVHHLPAAQNRIVYRRIAEESEKNNWGTAFVGLTATEVRPDRASVIAFFNKEISTEYQIGRGWEEGHLARMRYVSGDLDINPENKRVRELSDLATVYSKLKYHDSRFPHLKKLYDTHTEDLLDKRGLILAPTVERAQALTAYLKREGLEAICLTSAERLEDEEKFLASYRAWKNNRWPEKSKMEGTPVPQIVVAVDIFKEGVDVPAINMVMLWTDTNSTIKFMQSIGRGLRLAPFKTHLIVVDAVGLFRKLDLLRYLGAMYQPPDSPCADNDGSSAQDRDRREEDSEMLRPFNFSILMGEDVTKTVEDYLNDLPMHLEYRYKSYPLIPAKEFPKLDRYLAINSGFESIDEMNNYLKGVAQTIPQGITKKLLREFREKVRPVFYSSGVYNKEDGPEIPLFGSMFIIFHRFSELLMKLNPEVKMDHMYKLFPEFNPEKEALLKIRSKNLVTLRKHVFGMDRPNMVSELVKKIIEDQEIEPEGTLIDFLLLERESLLREEFDDLGIIDAEATRRDKKTKEGEILVGGEKFRTKGNIYSQSHYVGIYLLHPRLKGKLKDTDFERDPEEFKEFLVSLGLAKGPEGLKIFNHMLKKKIKAYTEAVDRGGTEEIKSAGTELNDILSDDNIAMLSSLKMSPRRMEIFHSFNNALNEAFTKLGDKHTEQDKEIQKRFSRILAIVGMRWALPIEVFPGAKMVLTRAGADISKFEISIPVKTKGAPLSLSIIEDYAGRTHIFIGDQTLTAMEELYGSMPDIDKIVLVDRIVDILSLLKNEVCGTKISCIVPKSENDKNTGFYTAIFRRILHTTDWGVIGLVDAPNPESIRDCDLNYDDMKESRLNFLSEWERNDLRSLIEEKGGLGRTNTGLAGMFFWLTKVIEFERSLENFQRRVSALDLSDEYKDIFSYVINIIARSHTDFAVYDYLTKRHRKNLSEFWMLFNLEVMNFLGSESADADHMKDRIYIAALYQILKLNFFIEGKGWKDKTRVRQMLDNYMKLVKLEKDHGRDIHPAVLAKVSAYAKVMVRSYRDNKTFPADARERSEEIHKELMEIQKAETVKKAPSMDKPPYFTEDGFLVLVETRTSKRARKKTVHWDPACPLIKGAGVSEVKDSMDFEYPGEKYSPCKKCGTPPHKHWDDYEKNWSRKYGKRVWSPPGTAQDRNAEDDKTDAEENATHDDGETPLDNGDIMNMYRKYIDDETALADNKDLPNFDREVIIKAAELAVKRDIHNFAPVELHFQAKNFAKTLLGILSENPETMYILAIDSDLGKEQHSQIMDIFRACDRIAEMFPNLKLVRRSGSGETKDLSTEVKDLIDEEKVEAQNVFMVVRQQNLLENRFSALKDQAWITAIDDSVGGGAAEGVYLPIFEAALISIMAATNADPEAIKNVYDSIALDPKTQQAITLEVIEEMVRNRTVLLLPKIDKIPLDDLQLIYERVKRVYIAA
ncbi:MAG: DEAD/DEAH box helicase [Candidatus Omnitrophica bacterium]|nr:DEAD/DEAH box helicase [Candidatus Omnitrophota bacterium]